MRLQPESPCKKAGKNKKIKEEKVQKSEDPFIELTEWLNQNTLPNKKLTYSQQQISELKDYIEMLQRIQLTKKTLQDKLIFRCKKYSHCGFQIVFQIKRPLKSSKNEYHPRYSVIYCPTPHPFKGNHNCFLTNQQVILTSRKKYLNLIKPLIKSILISNQLNPDEKSPTFLLKQLQILKKQQKDFLFKDLQGSYKRQLKKAFDNIILKTKNQIKLESQILIPKKRKISKSKKIKKVQKKKVKKENILDYLYIEDVYPPQNQIKKQIFEIRMIEEHEMQQKNMNVYEKCFNEVRMEEELFNQKSLKINLESKNFQTPTKKREIFGFDLQNSASKGRTTYNKSYRQECLFDSAQINQHIKSDSGSHQKN